MSYNLVEFNNIEMLKPLKDMHISFISMYVSIVSLNISNSTDKHRHSENGNSLKTAVTKY